MNSARVIIDVVAGVLPGQPDEEHSRRYTVSAEKWSSLDARGQRETLAVLVGQAQGYASSLMFRPDRFNWVKVEYVYV